MPITVTNEVHNVNIHRTDTMRANNEGRTSWLQIKTTDGVIANIFMDYDMACEIADLWKHMNREPEPRTFDEALGAKCDAEARMDEARSLKGMT